MKHPFSLFEKFKKYTILNTTRKSLMRDMILTEIAHKEGVRVDELLRLHRQEGSRRSFLEKINVVFNRMPITIIMSIVVLLGGGTSFAAERAKPGDILYPVKVHVNEEVRAAVSFSEEGKALWEARRAERRLEEAAALTEENAMNAEARAELEARFKAHAERIEERIEKMEERGDTENAEELATRFEASLKAHEAVLVALRARAEITEETKAEVRSVIEHILTETKSTAETRTRLEGKLLDKEDGAQVEAAAEGRIEASAKILAQTKEHIAKKKEQLGAEATADAEARLVIAETTLAEARTELTTKAYEKAFRLASAAARTAHEAKSLIDTRLNIDVKLDLDTRIQVQPTISNLPSSGFEVNTQNSIDSKIDAGTKNLNINGKNRNEIELKSNGGIQLNVGR